VSDTLIALPPLNVNDPFWPTLTVDGALMLGGFELELKGLEAIPFAITTSV
jgi:hypothetical protein